jgi:hypothetical protein
VKNIVYQVRINDLQHLQVRIRDAVATVAPNMMQATWNESNIVWIFVVPPKEPTLKCIDQVLYSEEKFDSFPW